jgi:quinol monooxygenase YgiN
VDVIRIDEFRSIADRHEELRRALEDILSTVRTSDGCASVDVFQSQTEPERVVVVERWRDQESHQKAMSSIHASALHRVMSLLAEMPAGAYYRQA